MKYLLSAVFFLVVACGGDGDGNINISANADGGSTVTIAANNPENISDIILANDSRAANDCNICCGFCSDNPTDGLEDNDCIAKCIADLDCNLLDFPVQACAFE